MTNLLPKLHHARNEIVAWAGLVTAAIGAFVVALGDIDLTSTEGFLLTVGPAVSALVGRANAYGPVSYQEAVAAARRGS